MPSNDQILPTAVQKIDPPLKDQAFTHRSLRSRQLPQYKTNERLEFLGDAVLELIVSDYLYNKYPRLNEGRLTRYRAALVRTESLASVAEEINLGHHLRTNLTGSDSDTHHLPSLMADTFEAILGALYLDQGYAACQEFVTKHLLSQEERFITAKDAKDPKSRLQELVQAQGLETPAYQTTSTTGPDHAKTFIVEVKITDKKAVSGKGLSKQKAEQAAAKAALSRYFPDQG